MPYSMSDTVAKYEERHKRQDPHINISIRWNGENGKVQLFRNEVHERSYILVSLWECGDVHVKVTHIVLLYIYFTFLQKSGLKLKKDVPF